MPRPFRFGTGIFRIESAIDYAESARRIESLGYSTFVVPDHFHSEGLAPVPALLAAAHATTALRIGSLVFDNDFRHPALLAKEAATLDLLSSGRLEFGIGAGWKKAEYDQAGISWDDAGVRVDRLDEAVRLIKLLWSGDPITFHGGHYRVTELISYPRPAQVPHPPILIGGGGRRLLSLAAREADIVGIIAQALPGGGLDVKRDSESLVREKIQWVREASGERFSGIELQSLIWRVVVTENRKAAAAAIAPNHNISAEEILASPYFLIGTIDAMVEELIRQRLELGISYFVVFPGDFEAFAPVVATLAGS
jgi:probable F420-dependent oxidoreductase